MKRKRQPREIWQATRVRIWQRDYGQCFRCCTEVAVNACHIDHKIPLSKGGSNGDDNLRVLCPRCHVLRADKSHQGMIAKAIKKGLIPPNWRELVWDD